MHVYPDNLIASHRVAHRRLSSENCRNLDQSPCRNVQAGSRSNPSCRTDRRTYEIFSLGSFPTFSPSPALIMFNICLFFSARVSENSGPVRSRGKTRFIATGGSYPRFIQSRIASVEIRVDLISRAIPTRKLWRGTFYLQLMARSRIWSISIFLF